MLRVVNKCEGLRGFSKSCKDMRSNSFSCNYFGDGLKCTLHDVLDCVMIFIVDRNIVLSCYLFRKMSDNVNHHFK